MPLPYQKSQMPPKGTDPIKFLSADAAAPGDDAEEGNMNDPCYKIIHGAVMQFGKDAVQAALDQCSADEQSEEDEAPEVPGKEAME